MGRRRVKLFLLDTGSAGDWIHRRGQVRQRAEEALARGAKIGICTPVLGELWTGIELSKTQEKNRHRLIGALAKLIVWPYEAAAAREFGRIFADLRRRGRMIGPIDIQTAAIALALGSCTVVTKDKDFLMVPGLKAMDWSE